MTRLVTHHGHVRVAARVKRRQGWTTYRAVDADTGRTLCTHHTGLLVTAYMIAKITTVILALHAAIVKVF